jgi:hypothetical protein
MNRNDALEAIGIFMIGLAILLAVGTVVALIWYVVATLAMEMRYRRYREQAEERFDYILKHEGVLDDIDSVLHAMFPGITVGQTNYQNAAEFTAGVLFGREHREDSA